MNYPLISTVVVCLYLIAVGYVGWAGRSLASDSNMFNIFGRRARTIRAMSGYLGLIGAGELITITQLGYDNGWHVLWFLAGLTSGYLFLSATSDRMRNLARDRGINTLSGYFSDQFGAAAGVAITIVFLFSLGSLLTIQFIVGSDLVHSITGVPSFVISIVMGAVIVGYLISAGFVAVLSTDVLRTVMMTIVLVVLVASIGFQFSSSTGVYSPLPIPDATVLFVLAFFGAVSAADIWQTIFASADKGVVRRSMIFAGVAILFIGLLIAQIGMVAKLALPSPPADTPILVAAAQQVFPGILAPLVALLITGSVMATADTEIWVISTILVSNAYPSDATASRTRGGGDTHDELRRWTRIAIPIVTIFAVAFAYVFHDALALFEGLLILLTAVGPTILAVMFFTPPRIAVTLALWAGLVAYVALCITYKLAIPTNYIALTPMFVSVVVFLAALGFSNRVSSASSS